MTHEEIRETINNILTHVNELHGKREALEAEKLRHQELITVSEVEIERCNNELKEVRENVNERQIEMDKVNHELFQLPENAAPDPAVEAEDNEQGKESSAKRLWNAQARKIRERGVA
jgi:chromosome segregation ATPase